MWIPAPEFNTVKAKSPQKLCFVWQKFKCFDKMFWQKKIYTKVWQTYLNHIHKHTNINITNTLQTSNDKWNIKGRHKVDRCIWDNRLSYLVCLDLRLRDFWTSSRSYTSNGTIFAELRLKHLREKQSSENRKTGRCNQCNQCNQGTWEHDHPNRLKWNNFSDKPQTLS